MYTHAHARSYMTCVPVMRPCAYTCVIHSYVTLGYIYLMPRLHLFFLHLLLHSPAALGFFNFDHAPSSFSGPPPPCIPASSLRASPARFLARFLEPLLSSSLSHYLGSDSICRTMLFTMWLHAGGPCSLGEMPELRQRVSLQSTTLLGTQNASRAVAPRARASTFADHRMRLVD